MPNDFWNWDFEYIYKAGERFVDECEHKIIHQYYMDGSYSDAVCDNCGKRWQIVEELKRDGLA